MPDYKSHAAFLENLIKVRYKALFPDYEYENPRQAMNVIKREYGLLRAAFRAYEAKLIRCKVVKSDIINCFDLSITLEDILFSNPFLDNSYNLDLPLIFCIFVNTGLINGFAIGLIKLPIASILTISLAIFCTLIFSRYDAYYD